MARVPSHLSNKMLHFHLSSFTAIKTQTCSLCLPTFLLFHTVCKDHEYMFQGLPNLDYCCWFGDYSVIGTRDRGVQFWEY